MPRILSHCGDREFGDLEASGHRMVPVQNQGEQNERNHRDKPQTTTCSADKKPLLVRTADLATCEPGTGQARNWAKTGIYGGHVYSLIHMIDGECILSPT